MNLFSTLIWKEYRNNTHLMVFAGSALLLPTILLTSMIFANAQADVSIADILSVGLIYGAVTGIIISQFTMLCLGGHLIGGERAGRTFEFLFLQPVSRLSIASSKLVFVLLWTIATWSIAGVLAWIGYLCITEGREPNLEFTNSSFFVEIASVGFLMFGAAWMASSRVENSVVAMCIGALATALVFSFLLLVVGDRFESIFTINKYDWTRIFAMSTVAQLCVIGGVILFVRRKAP
jgi:ABC-type transport system involved in multi-copper enzyme maturation permease subunit